VQKLKPSKCSNCDTRTPITGCRPISILQLSSELLKFTKAICNPIPYCSTTVRQTPIHSRRVINRRSHAVTRCNPFTVVSGTVFSEPMSFRRRSVYASKLERLPRAANERAAWRLTHGKISSFTREKLISSSLFKTTGDFQNETKFPPPNV
jgi:hypothetical protein